MPLTKKVAKIISPKVDGHFWVECDGVKIDLHFEYYDKVELANRGKSFYTILLMKQHNFF
jgi:hypothetical protein